MMIQTDEQRKHTALKSKILITANLKLLTGMHIGGNSDFAPIGAVDSPFIRDLLTHEPIIPGSSLKGKIRTLLAKSRTNSEILKDISSDDAVVARLFGYQSKQSSYPSRLQFFDLFLTEDSLETFKNLETDTYIGEVKFENTINRVTGVANPRQIERVPAGTEFAFKLVYNVETTEDLVEDMQVLADGFSLLQADYLGGHGSRGYGRVALTKFKVKELGQLNLNLAKFEQQFEGSNPL